MQLSARRVQHGLRKQHVIRELLRALVQGTQKAVVSRNLLAAMNCLVIFKSVNISSSSVNLQPEISSASIFTEIIANHDGVRGYGKSLAPNKVYTACECRRFIFYSFLRCDLCDYLHLFRYVLLFICVYQGMEIRTTT